jgi:hypothetical protein
MTDSNWLAVHDRVRQGLADYDVVNHPPTSEVEVGYLAETITDHVVAAVELSVEQQRAAKERRRTGRKGWFGRKADS